MKRRSLCHMNHLYHAQGTPLERAGRNGVHTAGNAYFVGHPKAASSIFQVYRGKAGYPHSRQSTTSRAPQECISSRRTPVEKYKDETVRNKGSHPRPPSTPTGSLPGLHQSDNKDPPPSPPNYAKRLTTRFAPVRQQKIPLSLPPTYAGRLTLLLRSLPMASSAAVVGAGLALTVGGIVGAVAGREMEK